MYECKHKYKTKLPSNPKPYTCTIENNVVVIPTPSLIEVLFYYAVGGLISIHERIELALL